MTDGAISPTDRRRASALLSHRASVDEVGARFVIDEALAADRTRQLLMAVIEHGGKLLAEFRTDKAIQIVNSMLEVWAQQEDDVDYRRAASLIICLFQSNTAYFDGHIADATADGRLAELVNTTAQCFVTLMPELNSPLARATLAAVTAYLSGEEPQGQ